MRATRGLGRSWEVLGAVEPRAWWLRGVRGSYATGPCGALRKSASQQSGRTDGRASGMASGMASGACGLRVCVRDCEVACISRLPVRVGLHGHARRAGARVLVRSRAQALSRACARRHGRHAPGPTRWRRRWRQCIWRGSARTSYTTGRSGAAMSTRRHPWYAKRRRCGCALLRLCDSASTLQPTRPPAGPAAAPAAAPATALPPPSRRPSARCHAAGCCDAPRRLWCT